MTAKKSAKTSSTKSPAGLGPLVVRPSSSAELVALGLLAVADQISALRLAMPEWDASQSTAIWERGEATEHLRNLLTVIGAFGQGRTKEKSR